MFGSSTELKFKSRYFDNYVTNRFFLNIFIQIPNWSLIGTQLYVSGHS